MSATPQGIDRDAVVALVEQLGLESAAIVRGLGPPLLDPVIWADRILALVRPVEGVTLTPEEASVVADLARNAARHTPSADEYRSLLDFAARLEAAQ